MSEFKDCPNCGLANVASAEVCDCGWAFLPDRPGRSLRDCPRCGGREFSRCKPKAWVAFVSDRKCKACGTRYTPPTPLWAAFIFIVVGVGTLVGGLAFVELLVSRESPNPLGLAFWACIATVGGAALWHGVRALLKRGRV
jgi:uncharacterized protein (DUF983 family)